MLAQGEDLCISESSIPWQLAKTFRFKTKILIRVSNLSMLSTASRATFCPAHLVHKWVKVCRKLLSKARIAHFRRGGVVWHS